MAPCGWEVEDCACGSTPWADFPAEVQARATALAAHVMWAGTGRRYGLCEVTVQPCRPKGPLPLYQVYPVEWQDWGYGAGPYPYIQDGQWFNRGWAPNCCRAHCEVPLPGPTTTAGIVEVTVAGDVIDPAAYQVQDGYLLVRIDGDCWPTCVNYSKQDPPEWTVTYERGDPIPPAIQAAFETLACEFARACVASGDCRLPTRLTSLTRQGVTVSVAETQEWIDLIRTQIPEVDQAMAIDNPGRLRARPQVLSPDMMEPRMVT